jgi:hypothetical protein
MNFNPLDPFAKKKAPDKSWEEVFRKLGRYFTAAFFLSIALLACSHTVARKDDSSMKLRIELDPGISPESVQGRSGRRSDGPSARRDSRETGNVCDIPFLLVQDHDG